MLAIYLPVSVVILFIYIGHERKHPKRRYDNDDEENEIPTTILSPFYLAGITFLYATNYIVSYQSITLDYPVTLPGEFTMLFGKVLYWIVSSRCTKTSPRIMFTTSLCVTLIMLIFPVSNTDWLVSSSGDGTDGGGKGTNNNKNVDLWDLLWVL